MTCPHCPDGHTPPDGGSQPWAAYLGPERDGDGQPTTIHVGRTAGAHVAEADAQWVRDRLNDRPASTVPAADQETADLRQRAEQAVAVTCDRIDYALRTPAKPQAVYHTTATKEPRP